MFRFDKVSKRFSEKFVLEDFSFTISAHDKVSVSGPSGIGKTTLFRLILGFEQPDSGTIYFNDRPYSDEIIWQVRKEIGYVSQDLMIGSGKVADFYEEIMSLKANLPMKNGYKDRLDGLLREFSLSNDVLEKDIEDLSGGEKQRIAIINALLLERKIFLLDEITASLDVELKRKVMDYFFLREEFTVLNISHDSYLLTNYNLKNISLGERKGE